MNHVKLIQVESGMSKTKTTNVGPLIVLHLAIISFVLVTFELHSTLFICCFIVFCLFFFFLSFRCLLSGSHHSGSPLARGARYCMSADSSKVYTIPQTSSSGAGPEPEPRPGSGLGSEACGQTRVQPACALGTATAAGDDDDDAHSSEGPPNISECG